MNDFNDKLDAYQSGLNAKIDNAISSYIAGLSSISTSDLENYAKNTASYGDEYVTFYNYPSDKGFDDGKKTNYGKAGSFYHVTYREIGAGMFYRMSSQSVSTADLSWSYVDFGEKNCVYFLMDGEYVDASLPYGYSPCLSSRYSNYNYITIGNWYAFNSLSNWSGNTNAATLITAEYSPKNHTIDIDNRDNFSGIYTGEKSIKICGFTKENGGTGADQNSDASISSNWTRNASLKFDGSGCPSANNIPSQTLYFVNYGNRNKYDGDQVTLNNIVGSGPGGRILTWGSDGTPGGDVRCSDLVFNYKYYWHKIYDGNATDLCNYAASKVADRAVKLYNGIPLTRVYNKGEVNFSCTFTNSEGNDVYLTISDEPFDNADRYSTKPYSVGGNTYDHILYNKKMVYGETTDVAFDVKYIADRNKGTVLYYRLSQENDSQTNVSFKLNVDDKITIKIDE